MSKLDSEPATDRRGTLALALRRRILTMQMEPGALLDEYALAEEFGMSRPPGA